MSGGLQLEQRLHIGLAADLVVHHLHLVVAQHHQNAAVPLVDLNIHRPHLAGDLEGLDPLELFLDRRLDAGRVHLGSGPFLLLLRLFSQAFLYFVLRTDEEQLQGLVGAVCGDDSVGPVGGEVLQPALATSQDRADPLNAQDTVVVLIIVLGFLSLVLLGSNLFFGGFLAYETRLNLSV